MLRFGHHYLVVALHACRKGVETWSTSMVLESVQLRYHGPAEFCSQLFVRGITPHSPSLNSEHLLRLPQEAMFS
jgi:hypothetical protein